MKNNKGFTLVELLIVVGIIVIIAAIVIPGMIRTRQFGNAATAIGSLRAINSAQSTYVASCGNGFYSPTLVNLGVAPASGMPFISPELSAGVSVTKDGYLVTMGSTSGMAISAPPSCNGLPAGKAMQGFYATATPTATRNGVRAFGTNTSYGIFYAVSQVPLAMTDTTAPADAKQIW